MPMPAPTDADGEAKPREENSGRKGKGGGKGKGWGKGWGKGKWKFVPARKELTPQEIEERRKVKVERHDERTKTEERKVLTEEHIEGEVVQRARWHAWVKPKDPSQIPPECREQLAQMNAEFRAKVTDGRAFCGGVEGDVLYLAVADIAEESVFLNAGLPVKFKVYSDVKGVGACDVVAGTPVHGAEVVAA
mmetsp:Transcript_166251/g.528193  ORF Transcript_166251/g.528193 Transcript_166251/m.528193 type:complete len:191 (+) Transcript_166251:2-574(+)